MYTYIIQHAMEKKKKKYICNLRKRDKVRILFLNCKKLSNSPFILKSLPVSTVSMHQAFVDFQKAFDEASDITHKVMTVGQRYNGRDVYFLWLLKLRI